MLEHILPIPIIYEYLSTPDSTDHDVMQDTGCVKAGLSWHGIYFAFTLSFVNLIFYQRPHSHSSQRPHSSTFFILSKKGRASMALPFLVDVNHFFSPNQSNSSEWRRKSGHYLLLDSPQTIDREAP